MYKETEIAIVRGMTKLIGLIGRNIAYTLSPPMHNTMFRTMGLDYVYVPLPVEPEHLKDAIAGIKALNFVGVNVTIPYKEEVIPLLDWISDDARDIGAVNTVKVEDDSTLSGYNTDVYGFLQSVKEELNFVPQDKRILVIGAGGAGRAIATGCVKEGAKRVVLVDIISEKLENLKKDLLSLSPTTEIVGYLPNETEKIETELSNIDLVANATPIGMNPQDKPPIPLNSLNKQAVVFDAIYAVKETATMRSARLAGCSAAINGIGMLVHQGAKGFELWTGKKPDTKLMRKVVESHIYENQNLLE